MHIYALSEDEQILIASALEIAEGHPEMDAERAGALAAHVGGRPDLDEIDVDGIYSLLGGERIPALAKRLGKGAQYPEPGEPRGRLWPRHGIRP
jgi:hypothetical protein